VAPVDFIVMVFTFAYTAIVNVEWVRACVCAYTQARACLCAHKPRDGQGMHAC
jgi:hypothetical protein